MAKPLTAGSLDHLTSWHSKWDGLKVVVLGLGATGFAVTDTLMELGAEVLTVALDADEDVVNIARVVGAEVVVSADSALLVDAVESFGAEVAVVSPGVDRNDPVILALQKRGIPLWSDIDFAWRVRDKYEVVADWIVVAGDSHASRIADLATRILVADGQRVGVGGFQAPAVLDLIRDPIQYQRIVVHASTESLHWWQGHPESLREPLVSVCVESDLEPHAAVLYDGSRLACVYWRGSGNTESLVEDADVVEGARAIGVGPGSPGMSDVGLVEGILVDRAFLEDRRNQALEISTIEELREAGWSLPDDLPVIMGAIAIARALDVSPALIAGVISLP